jgi:hypothetical protein
MLDTFKRFFGGTKSPAAAVAVTPAVPADETWASFDVDPELAYHCRDQAASTAADDAPAVVAVELEPLLATAPAAEVQMPEFRLLDSEASDAEDPAIGLGGLAVLGPAPAARVPDAHAAVGAVETPAATRKPKKVPAPKAKAKGGPKKATKKPGVKGARVPAKSGALPRRQTFDLRGAWNLDFATMAPHDDSVENIRLELAVSE